MRGLWIESVRRTAMKQYQWDLCSWLARGNYLVEPLRRVENRGEKYGGIVVAAALSSPVYPRVPPTYSTYLANVRPSLSS